VEDTVMISAITGPGHFQLSCVVSTWYWNP